MTPIQAFFAHWYFHVPNLLVTALICALLASSVVQLVFFRRPDALLVAALRALSAPVLTVVRAITPAVAPPAAIVAFAIAWLLAARIVWFLICSAAGMRLSLGG